MGMIRASNRMPKRSPRKLSPHGLMLGSNVEVQILPDFDLGQCASSFPRCVLLARPWMRSGAGWLLGQPRLEKTHRYRAAAIAAFRRFL